MTLVGKVNSNKEAADITKRLNAHKGEPVLLLNSSGGNGLWDLFRIEDAEFVRGDRKVNAWVSIHNAAGRVYELEKGIWVPTYHDWGRNYFPEKGSQISIGRSEVLATLQQRLEYHGDLPF